ncbi:hypothetical protein cand_016340 [Cryptosporidium andersoni]|uniref:Uncharacterized protein n=1 Tax=Cryptosporidium andersoni TaxID=117008 RepID=A0A1J4MTA6_9CRYT|nr:hypothetical protein cand_016340 [Cryptosporidium andersoni]
MVRFLQIILYLVVYSLNLALIYCLDVNSENSGIFTPLRPKAAHLLRPNKIREGKVRSEKLYKYIQNYYNSIAAYVVALHLAHDYSCIFNYKFVNLPFPILVDKEDDIGWLQCMDNNTTIESIVQSVCYGTVQLPYPLTSADNISIRNNEEFVTQICFPVFPPHPNVPFYYPKIPNNQAQLFPSKLFTSKNIKLNREQRARNNNVEYQIVYYLSTEYLNSDCMINRFLNKHSFTTTMFSVLGILVCTINSSEDNPKIFSEVIRSYCAGIGLFNIHKNFKDFAFFPISKMEPFLQVFCIKSTYKELSKRINTPDKSIRDIIRNIK